LVFIIPPVSADLFPASGPVVSGKTARLRSGKAAAPKSTRLAVKRAIWASNQLRSRPYRYGGGHKSFDDLGYDCSGTVSYALGAAGLIASPLSSTEFRSYGERGRGKWITIYPREGHTFAVIAGLRHTIITPANGRRVGMRLTGRPAVLTRGIRLGCD
jgi:hypothetical protein